MDQIVSFKTVDSSLKSKKKTHTRNKYIHLQYTLQVIMTKNAWSMDAGTGINTELSSRQAIPSEGNRIQS